MNVRDVVVLTGLLAVLAAGAALLFGWLPVERSLRNDPTLGAGAYANRLVPDPSNVPPSSEW